MSLERLGTCVPITALKAFVWNGCNYIFQGQGPLLQVIDHESGNVLAQTRPFKRNNVHGFIELPSPHSENPSHARIIAWGGQSLRVVDIHVKSEAMISLVLSSAEFLSPDWIMNGCLAGDNQPDAAYLITANNAPLKLQLLEGNLCGKVSIHLSQMATSVKSILCAADLVALSPSHLLIAAGTIFGEIIVWSCFTKNDDSQGPKFTGSIHHFFTGHDGTVFGVRISPKIPSLRDGTPGRLLASCSDDRTVRIWDISDCEGKTPDQPAAYSTDGFDLRSTGFSVDGPSDTANTSESCVAKAFGHAARIWDVKFRPIKFENSMIGLVTRGEDSTCVVWDLAWESSSTAVNYRLVEKSSIKNHSGKHIWAFDLRSNNQETVVYSGGADGALKYFRVNELTNYVDRDVPTRSGMSKSDGISSFASVAPDQVIVCTAQGNIQIGRIGFGPMTSVTWERLCTSETISTPNIMTGIPEKGLAIISDVQGRVRLYNHTSQSVSDLVNLGKRVVYLFYLPNKPQVKKCTQTFSFVISYAACELSTLVTVSGWEDDSLKVEQLQFYLPTPRFEISSAEFAYNGEYLLLGSKLGGFAVFKVQGLGLSSSPLLVERRTHGFEGTNHIQILPLAKEVDDQEEVEYVLTCGRDGNYCLHELKIGKNSHDDAISFNTIHRATSGLVGNIEGAYLDPITGDLMIYGFKTQEFILRNESKQRDIISIPSGGARRLWSFQQPVKDGTGPLLLWRDKSELRTWRIQMDLYQTLRAGVHGREIKTVDTWNAPKEKRSLFATGAEDTLVHIYAPLSPDSAGPWGSFECLRTFNTHKSGVQQVKWSQDGKYLFTCSAYEEFFVWRTRWVQSFGLATVLAATAPKTDPKSELRITSFDIISIEEFTPDCSYLICMVLPNSMIRILHFSPNDDNRFTLLATGKYMTNCLTQCHIIRKESSLSLITASTDGYFTVWDLTSALEPFFQIHSSSIKSKKLLEDAEIKPTEITCEDRFQIHSNSVKSMDLVPYSEKTTIILSGGDDNKFSVSILQTDSEKTSVTSSSIPDAHAASVTTTTVFPESIKQTQNGIKFHVVSSGNDHRIKLWSIAIIFNDSGEISVALELILDKYSSVADISSSSLLKAINLRSEPSGSQPSSATNKPKLLICGVGIEMFEAIL